MDTAIDLQVYTVRQIEEMGLSYAIGGSMAVAAYGTPRFTRDVDIVVDLPLEQASAFAARFPRTEFYIDEGSIRDAVRERGQFNIIHLLPRTKNNNKGGAEEQRTARDTEENRCL